MFGDYIKDFKKIEFNARRGEAERITQKYPDRCPVVIDRHDGSPAPYRKKHKYLVPRDLTVGQFLYIIRKQLKLNHEQAIFLFINESIPASSSLIGDVFEERKNVDGFLYAVYSLENTFG